MRREDAFSIIALYLMYIYTYNNIYIAVISPIRWGEFPEVEVFFFVFFCRLTNGEKVV